MLKKKPFEKHFTAKSFDSNSLCKISTLIKIIREFRELYLTKWTKKRSGRKVTFKENDVTKNEESIQSLPIVSVSNYSVIGALLKIVVFLSFSN